MIRATYGVPPWHKLQVRITNPSYYIQILDPLYQQGERLGGRQIGMKLLLPLQDIRASKPLQVLSTLPHSSNVLLYLLTKVPSLITSPLNILLIFQPLANPRPHL
jgi:hypothetical protein